MKSKSYAYVCKISNLKYSLIGFFKTNKLKIFVLIFIVLLALITGIFTAIKYIKTDTLFDFNNFGLTEFSKGNIASLSLFFQRLLSYLVVLSLLFLCSLYAPLFPVGCIIIAYRSFLLGLNVALIISLCGISGLISALLIFLFQFFILFLCAVFLCLCRKKIFCKRKFGKGEGINAFLLFLIFVLLMTIVNLLETLILILLSANVILVI